MSDKSDINRGFLKEKLGNYQVDPPEKVWDGISGQTGSERNRKGLYLILLVSAASIALAVTLGIPYFTAEDAPMEAYLEQQRQEVEPSVEDAERNEEIPAALSPMEQKVVETMASLSDEQEDPSTYDQGPDSRELKAFMETPAGNNRVKQENRDPSERVEETPGQAEEEQVSLAIQSRDPEEESEEASDPLILLQEDAVPDLLQDPELELETLKKRNPRWMLGAALSPLYSFRDAEAGVIPEGPDESGMLSYSTGVNVSYRRNSRFAIETGIYYNRTGIAIGAPGIRLYNQSYDNVIFGAGSEQAAIRTVNNSVGNIIAYSGDIYMNGYKINAENSGSAYATEALNEVDALEPGIQQHLDYLELPFNLRYSLIDRAFELQLVGGMSTNFLVDNYVTVEGPSGQEEIGYLSNINTVNYSGNAGLGMIYHFGEKLSLVLEPRFRYFLNSVNDSTLPSTRPYSMGFYTGLSYTF